MQNISKYQPKNHIRIVTAAALFDGHDAAINIMRRLIQDTGVEVIHLGHNRSVLEIVNCAIQEDANAIAITSYQGGHMEFFKYMYDLLHERNAGHIRIYGGGGGVILPSEIQELHAYGINRVFSPDDGRSLGLQGMINLLVQESDFALGLANQLSTEKVKEGDFGSIARMITAVENYRDESLTYIQQLKDSAKGAPVIGITGTGGAGKSSLVDELVRRFLSDFPDKKIAILSVDPSRRRTGGALLGDRIRMNAIDSEQVYMRSLATRQANLALSKSIEDALAVLKAAPFDLILLETSGIGQSDTEVVDHSNITLYVMTPEFGAPTQLEKIDMLDYADMVAINKFDKYGALDALRHVRKQFQRNRQMFDKSPEEMPVFSTMASQFNDGGVTALYTHLLKQIELKMGLSFQSEYARLHTEQTHSQIIPPQRVRYLSEITETIRTYNQWAREQADTANKLYSYHTTLSDLPKSENEAVLSTLKQMYEKKWELLTLENQKTVKNWDTKLLQFKSDEFIYKVRDREIRVQTYTETLSHLKIPKIAVPAFKAWGEILRWSLLENFPGEFPYAAGVFPFKREAEDPTRMFAGEGGPERTNKRFHYVSKNMPAVRLSTAFDSVTLYGEDPHLRPDIYGKIGNAGVSIACLDDAKKLYSGFDLASPTTSVSMTINGPAPIMTAYFMNVAIDQQCEKYIREHNLVAETEKKIEEIYKKRGTKRPQYQGALPEGNNGLGLLLLGVTGPQVLPADVYNKIKADTLCSVRGTVQADILKEDQAQNTCIFSIDFSLKLMGDVQEYFIKNYVQNFYSVSISGYHIAEAGANPISQLAFTLANGFTYVEYYLARGMHIDDFAPNLSFFFSNGVDPEYSVIGRVSRIIWAKAMKIKYKANERSQKLKYHIQTSGRSLHAQEIEFNDIRTTLQALYAIYDNCNSLHTNAYDEAITTPTEDSVRRAMAIQMIINHELGLAKNQNPNQGAFIIEELTALVEEAVMMEFDRITERGGVLGAMESMYQRSKIQEESLYYESLKNNGKLPIMGVNTFLSAQGSPTVIPLEVIRSTDEEKKYQLSMLDELHKTWAEQSGAALEKLQHKALQDQNLFDELMDTTKYCSLGQITHTLYQVGGQYRRNM